MFILVALGAIGLFLSLPGKGVTLARAGMIFLAAAAATLVVLLVRVFGPQEGRAWFAILSLVALTAAVRVITHRKPVYSALYFILVVVATAGMMILMQAEFLAVALLIVYAGAILVTYVFVIMLAQREGPPPGYDTQAREPLFGVLAGFLVLAVITARMLTGTVEGGPVIEATAGQVATVGERLLTEYVVGVQLAGLLLLVAMVGAIAIARRRAYASEQEAQD